MDIVVFVIAATGLVGWFLWTPRRKAPVRRFGFAPLCEDDVEQTRRRREHEDSMDETASPGGYDSGGASGGSGD